MNNWTITKTETDQRSLESANSVFTISNGYLSLKGNLQENKRGRMPTTIVHGVFDEANMIKGIPPSGRERRYLDDDKFDDPKPYPCVANLPDPLWTQIFVNDRELAFRRASVYEFRQTWDLRRGLYSYEYVANVPGAGRVRVKMERFASMVRTHAAAMRYTLTPMDDGMCLVIRSGIDGTIKSNLMGDKPFEVVDMQSKDGDRLGMTARTPARDILVRILAADTISGVSVTGRSIHEDARVHNVFETSLQANQSLVLEKVILLDTTEDTRHGVDRDAVARMEELEACAGLGFDKLLTENAAWWEQTWNRIDVQIDGDDLAQQYLRFCLMHLAMAAPRHAQDLSVPCKLLTGEWYQGSVFYDTDLYIVPFYTFTDPTVARSCVDYRWGGLEHGREIARHFGYKGAKFAWQSGPYGEEVLAPWYRFVHTNIHINGDVAYMLMQYVLATGDEAYLRQKGIDILVESARFYTSRARWDDQGKAHLDDVSGPDEGHCESTDNYYTNYMAKRTLEWAAETLERFRAEAPEAYSSALERLSIGTSEPGEWRRTAEALAFLFDPETRVYEQYDGYYDLKPIPPGFKDDQKEWWFTVFPYQAIHQPDVVMAQTLFRGEIPEGIYRANHDFYLDRSMDFSSMSYVIHSLSAKALGDMDRAYRQFIITAGEDLDESLTGRGDVADGLHGTATGGAWMAAVMGFGGLWLSEKGLAIDPRLPAGWTRLAYNITLRGEWFRVEITPERITIQGCTETDVAIPATVAGQAVTLRSGETVELAL